MSSMFPELKEAWDLAWKAIDLEPPAREFGEVIGAYQQRAGRHYYHDIVHLSEVASLFSEHVAHFMHPGEAGIAIFYHDFAYTPGNSNNEQESADKAVDVLHAAGADPGQLQMVQSLILATRHAREAADTKDQRLVVDIDLAILGAPRERYDAYARGVREEFRAVPSPIFNLKRRQFLEGLLHRPSIYQTDRFRSLYEGIARENIHREILDLAAA